jgi:hypothetical protein
MNSMPVGKTFTPPLFVLFGDGTLLAYDAISDVSLRAGATGLDGLCAWDGVGHRIVLASAENDGVNLGDVYGGTSERADLEHLLADRLRNANVRNVDAMSFDELVYKASIRMIAPRRSNGRTELVGGLLGAVLRFFGGP